MMSKKTYHYTTLFHLAFLLVLIVFQGCKTETGDKLNSSDEEKILLKSVEEFNLAFKEGNIEQLETLITENYVHTNGNSKSINKTTWLAYLEKRKLEIDNGNLVINSYAIEEVEIELRDDMAIVTGKIVTSSTKSGEYQENEYRITNVWIKEEGNWKRAGFHDGKIN